MGVKIAELMARICETQLHAGEYCLLEVPSNSELSSFACIQRMLATGRVGVARCSQSVVGWQSGDMPPVYKLTDSSYQTLYREHDRQIEMIAE